MAKPVSMREWTCSVSTTTQNDRLFSGRNADFESVPGVAASSMYIPEGIYGVKFRDI